MYDLTGNITDMGNNVLYSINVFDVILIALTVLSGSNSLFGTGIPLPPYVQTISFSIPKANLVRPN